MLFGITWMDPNWLLDQFGPWFLWVCLAIVLIECGLFFPVLPGDTLLFAVGLFVSSRDNIVPGPSVTDLPLALVLLSLAAFAGNVLGYEIGRALGPPIYEREGRFIKRKYFEKTAEFFDQHGNKALVIGRFVPFVRTYITVVAGVTTVPSWWCWPSRSSRSPTSGASTAATVTAPRRRQAPRSPRKPCPRSARRPGRPSA